MATDDLNILSPFNPSFCIELEYHLCEAFENADRADPDRDTRGFWCDGVCCPEPSEPQMTRKRVNDTRKMVTKAWIGKNGQGEYEMTIRFGRRALSRYAKGRALTDCLPGAETMDWIDIDIRKKIIEIRLD